MSKWTKEEELDLIKDIANGLQIEHIAIKRNRSNSAIELRLKKIIFENIVAGRTPETMAKKLHLSFDKINQYFYAYKDFKEKHSGNVDDIANLKSNNSDIFCEHKKHSDNIVFSKLQKEIEQIKDHAEEKYSGNHNQHGGSKIINLESKIKQLELENKLINLIVENKQLNSQLNKLIKDGKVDKNIKIAIKNIREKHII
jgi:hypothetical protein